jgi:hypothetical protein
MRRVKARFQTIPPECQHCGIIDSPDFGAPVDCYEDNEPDPRWFMWLCANCRTDQWHASNGTVSLREFLGQTELEHKYWVEGKWEPFADAYYERVCGND